jgi:hypothetical protein
MPQFPPRIVEKANNDCLALRRNHGSANHKRTLKEAATEPLEANGLLPLSGE